MSEAWKGFRHGIYILLVQLTTLKRANENLTGFVSAEFEKVPPFVPVIAQLDIYFVATSDQSEKSRLFCKKDSHASEVIIDDKVFDIQTTQTLEHIQCENIIL